MTIGNIIFELRKERNLSQKKLADFIGVNQATIAKIEVNRNEATAETIRKLAKFFDVTSDYLLGLEDDFGANTNMPTNSPLSYTTEERELIEKYRNLPEQLKKLVRDQLDIYSSHNELIYKADKKV